MITTNFTNGILEVYKNNHLIISQPFKPTSTGEQIAWANETQALEWFNTVRSIYEYEEPVVEPPPTGIEQTPAQENQQGVQDGTNS
jgi:hypothetical protein